MEDMHQTRSVNVVLLSTKSTKIVTKSPQDKISISQSMKKTPAAIHTQVPALVNKANLNVSVRLSPVYLPKSEVTVPSSPGLLWYTSSPPRASAGVIDWR